MGQFKYPNSWKGSKCKATAVHQGSYCKVSYNYGTEVPLNGSTPSIRHPHNNYTWKNPGESHNDLQYLALDVAS